MIERTRPAPVFPDHIEHSTDTDMMAIVAAPVTDANENATPTGAQEQFGLMFVAALALGGLAILGVVLGAIRLLLWNKGVSLAAVQASSAPIVPEFVKRSGKK